MTNELGQPVAEYTYGAYGELLSGDASFTRFLYNGRCGVSTDENGLYYMRQRYYNVDIRRFINQDIITGDLTNSQSLNRYAYVQGNPVKYTDPFGLSPEDGGNKGGNFWHSLLGFIGIIPGPIGAVANAVDAGIYLSEGNYAMAAMCALDAVIPAAGAVGKALAGTCKYARIGREIATGAKVANTVFNLSRGMYNADRAVGSFCERHKDDLFTDKFRWTKADTADLTSFGLSSLTCFISGKSLAKDLDDFMAASTDLATLGASVGCFVAGTVVKTEEGDKAIEEIEVGDRVLAYEATTGRFAYKEVADVIAHDGVTELAHVTIGGETIDSTTNHPYFVVGYGYVDAGNLIEGDTVLLANGKEGKVERVEIEFLTEPVTVYNFEVKDWHCYFVGEAGVLVHNEKPICKEAPKIAASAGGKTGEGENISIRKSEHASIRSGQGRNVNTAINDINKSSPSKIYLQDDGRIVVKGDKGRVHILESDGEIVTTMNKVTNFNDRVSSGRYRPLTETERNEFVNKFDNYLGKAWDEYR